MNDAVYQLLLNHGTPMRNAAYTGNGFAASTRDTGAPLGVHLTLPTGRSAGHEMGKHPVRTMSCLTR